MSLELGPELIPTGRQPQRQKVILKDEIIIFILFIIKSLEKLKPGGILSFVLPNSFLNCLYYEKTRDFIVKKYQILNIIECHDKYLETGQETIILIIKKIELILNTPELLK